VILTLETLFLWSLLGKRESFSYEKAIKTDIYEVRFALIIVFSFKNYIISSTLRALYKNAQIFTPVRYGSRFWNKSVLMLKTLFI
jgi:hypothetical protein